MTGAALRWGAMRPEQRAAKIQEYQQSLISKPGMGRGWLSPMKCSNGCLQGLRPSLQHMLKPDRRPIWHLSNRRGCWASTSLPPVACWRRGSGPSIAAKTWAWPRAQRRLPKAVKNGPAPERWHARRLRPHCRCNGKGAAHASADSAAALCDWRALDARLVFSGAFIRNGPEAHIFPMALPLCILYAQLGFTRLFYNSLGAKGMGIQLYFLSPTPFRTVLLAKNLFILVLFCAPHISGRRGVLAILPGWAVPDGTVVAATQWRGFFFRCRQIWPLETSFFDHHALSRQSGTHNTPGRLAGQCAGEHC